MCEFASYSLADALSQITSNCKIDVVELYSDWRAENWNNNGYVLNSYPHAIVVVQFRDNIEFYDPTYGQIDHRKAGKILHLSKVELSKYYRSNLEEDVSYRFITESRDRKLKQLEHSLHLTENDRQALIRTIL